ncbi:MAG: hypothetical protein HYW62_03710 [Candidatus Levybacteria bacterium]|nr:hypothetical protein [Candidatus Levybacteria bacterium]
MLLSDLLNIFQWWATFFFAGVIFIPITTLIFPNFFDKGYIFAKVIGIALISYTIFVLGFLKLLPFETQNLYIILGLFIPINLLIGRKSKLNFKQILPIIIIEEFLFAAILLFWSFIHAHQPDIHGLEKYMDYGFINSILRAKYFPPLDMWLTPYPINYYYFGHLVTAVLTKLSFLSSSITFNLTLSTIAAFTFTGAFSIGANLLYFLNKNGKNSKLPIIGGILTGLILGFAGNLHTVYLFFKPYENENPVPFWQLIFSPNTFPNSYWYPNATRFIENTIHEFPIYSSVVSDLHGHVLDIPFVLLTIAILLSIFFRFNNQSSIQNLKFKIQSDNSKFKILNFEFPFLTFNFSLLTLLAFLLAIMYMINAWDGIIYFLLTAIVIAYVKLKSIIQISPHQSIKYYVSSIKQSKYLIPTTLYLILIFVGFFLFTLPFNLNFKPFASGIGVLCAPKFLTDIGQFGPFLFEPDHCQHSPLWQLFILYGFFYFWIFGFLVFKIRNFSPPDIFVLILILLSALLIIIPEFIYVKDIYPAHYRANTMFKLVYQSFMMLSISSGYIMVRLVSSIKYYVLSIEKKILYVLYFIPATLYLILVFFYPYFAINSYFGNLKTYHGLDGTSYLKPLYPNDYEAILWINKNIKGQPIILEAQGDSYTDYGRVSANTGLPTVLGWTVHEWLWRGTYDIPSPRIEEVAKMYESDNSKEIESLLKKYKVSLIFIGELERQKYPNLNEEKFQLLGKTIYQKGDTRIFQSITEEDNRQF